MNMQDEWLIRLLDVFVKLNTILINTNLIPHILEKLKKYNTMNIVKNFY